jgi:N-acetylglucosaminyldiphosphoundecaprenol N-acetyl-beta-D-mannosaminyltransferase
VAVATSPGFSGLLHEQKLPTFRVLNTFVHAIDQATVEMQLRTFLDEEVSHHVVTANIDFLRLAHSLPSFAQLLNEADLVVPDGKPVEWIGRYLGFEECQRTTGPEIIDICSRLSVERGDRIFLLGGQDGVAEEAGRVLEARFPGVTICGTYSPPECDYPFEPTVESEIKRQLIEADPQIVFVGFGCPKQELWIRDHRDLVDARVFVGIGGSFNFISGHVRRAPHGMQRLGLEWIYRLCMEPRRLWRRYLQQDLPFALWLVAHEARRKVGLRLESVFRLEA